jgi:hypothetical protein
MKSRAKITAVTDRRPTRSSSLAGKKWNTCPTFAKPGIELPKLRHPRGLNQGNGDESATAKGGEIFAFSFGGWRLAQNALSALATLKIMNIDRK